MAFIQVKSLHCDLCGTAQYEWDENRHAYEPVETFCMGCYLKAGSEDGETFLPGTSITLMDTESVEYARRQTEMTKRTLDHE